METTISQIKQDVRRALPGDIGTRRAAEIEAFLRKMLADYSAAFGVAADALLAAFEKCRTYAALNYYQEANFPALAGVILFDDLDDFKRRHPSGHYVCPSCGGETDTPFWCKSGRSVGEGKERRVCDWKAHGKERTLGKGMRLAFRNHFLEHPVVEEIFMPVEAVEKTAMAA